MAKQGNQIVSKYLKKFGYSLLAKIISDLVLLEKMCSKIFIPSLIKISLFRFLCQRFLLLKSSLFDIINSFSDLSSLKFKLLE